jgi:hypothetical protein
MFRTTSVICAVLLMQSTGAVLSIAQTSPKAPSRELVAVLDLDSVNASAPQVSVSSERLRQELLNSGSFRIVDRGQMTKILDEQSLQQTGCTSQECAVQVGKVLGVRKLVVGKLTKVEDSFWVVSAALVDVESGETVRVVSADVDGNFRKLLDSGIGELAARLTGSVVSGPATVTTKAPVIDAAVKSSRDRLKVGVLQPMVFSSAIQGVTYSDVLRSWTTAISEIPTIEIVRSFDKLSKEESELVERPKFQPGLWLDASRPNPDPVSALAGPYGADYVITAYMHVSNFDLTVFFFAVDTKKVTVLSDKFYVPIRSGKIDLGFFKNRLSRSIGELPKPPM